MTFSDFKKLLPFIDVDSINDNDIVLIGHPPYMTLSGWLQEEIRIAQLKAKEAERVKA